MTPAAVKYALLVGDGMADFPIPELGNRTPLEYAATPAMDEIARSGCVGRVQTVPEGIAPGSDVANMALMGYDPRAFYSGRAPIEAASMGVSLADGDVAFRCNLVTLEQGLMRDYSSGHIETQDAREIIEELSRALGADGADCRLYPGMSYRHLLVLRDIDPRAIDATPPHDITDKLWAEHLPSGPGSERLIALMERARVVLASSATNRRRIENGKRPATDIWLWGQGHAIKLPTLMERYALRGSVISAVDLVRGLGVLAGLSVRMVEGATGYLGTNYAGKVAAAAAALAEQDFVYVHIEAPDETSHEGSLEKKIQAIEEFDRNVVREMLSLSRQVQSLRILVAPDHATPLSMKTHHSMAVPFAVCGCGVTADGAVAYSERDAEHATIIDGPTMFDSFIRGTIAQRCRGE